MKDSWDGKGVGARTVVRQNGFDKMMKNLSISNEI
jgi:hypothetical protein